MPASQKQLGGSHVGEEAMHLYSTGLECPGDKFSPGLLIPKHTVLALLLPKGAKRIPYRETFSSFATLLMMPVTQKDLQSGAAFKVFADQANKMRTNAGFRHIG